MTILQESKIARANARPQGGAHGCAAMTILQESKIARANARPQGGAHGWAAMTILQESKIARANARPQGGAQGSAPLDRRLFLKSLLAGIASLPLLPIPALAGMRGRKVILQSSPVAGFQYYEGGELFDRMAVGAPLQLVREAENRYDSNAVAVYFSGRKLGYVPRAENCAISQLMDRGEELSAYIASLQRSRNPWERLRFEVMLDA